MLIYVNVSEIKRNELISSPSVFHKLSNVSMLPGFFGSVFNLGGGKEYRMISYSHID